jgi:hypothetical protein
MSMLILTESSSVATPTGVPVTSCWQYIKWMNFHTRGAKKMSHKYYSERLKPKQNTVTCLPRHQAHWSKTLNVTRPLHRWVTNIKLPTYGLRPKSERMTNITCILACLTILMCNYRSYALRKGKSFGCYQFSLCHFLSSRFHLLRICCVSLNNSASPISDFRLVLPSRLYSSRYHVSSQLTYSNSCWIRYVLRTRSKEWFVGVSTVYVWSHRLYNRGTDG